MNRSLRGLAALFALSAATVACSADKAIDQATKGPGAAAPAPKKEAPKEAAAPAPPTAKMDFGETDFAESDRNRDPFRSYAALFQPLETKKPVTKNQKTVILARYSLDELKLVAIVTGGDFPRAMMLDPSNKGHVIKRGDFIGRPEVVHVGGANGTDYQLNWRVDKVRDGDVVFTREDPAQPGVPPASRVISLHPEPEKANQFTD